jgi:hypothetical protein
MEYLVLHTKLLCKYNRELVHEYVKKDYYPIGECLAVVKEVAGAERAVAELLRRNGNFLQSLQAFLDIADSLPLADMASELHSTSKSTKNVVISST